MTAADYALLRRFRAVFEGVPYYHRNSSIGDRVAQFIYEDLYTLDKSAKLKTRIDARVRVVNIQNRTVGKVRRRGDGTFGELVPAAVAVIQEGFIVARGPVATIEIGAETKILAKAMIKQIDRVIGDLIRQIEEFRKHGGNPICLAIVGVNFAERYTSFEGERQWPTDGGHEHKHPIQEAAEAVSRLEQRAKSHFDEFLLLKFVATNVAPFPFSWVNENQTVMEYSALLTRVSREYDRRFV
jgi:hypothetical protein